jgi:hypothetical protein
MKNLLVFVTLLIILTACSPGDLVEVSNAADILMPTELIQGNSTVTEAVSTPTDLPAPTSTSAPTKVNEPSPTSAAIVETEPQESDNLVSPVFTQASGPDDFPEGFNPLTGLPVGDPSLLALPPALISVTNFPVSARPQAGLSFAPYVFELYIGEGMTRFLAVFYGQFPSIETQEPADSTVITDNQPEIGPVRSGRLPYQAIRKMYNGFLVMASASPKVEEVTTAYTNIFGSDDDDINSALIDVTKLRLIADAQNVEMGINLTGNTFNEVPPGGGQDAASLWVFYNYYNQVQWTYNFDKGAYQRFQDNADGSGEFTPATDRLTGDQLSFENVIVLFAKHEALNSDKTLIDVDLLYSEGDAYLFRDGQIYPIYWTTLSREYEKSTGRLRPIRFTDYSGNPIPLKPGSTWVELVDLTTSFTEIQPGSWKARFYAP